MQQYVITFVSDLPQVGGVLRVLQFPPPIKLTLSYRHDIAEILLKVALNIITQLNQPSKDLLKNCILYQRYYVYNKITKE
jgi:hypothetical protein